jgi:Dipeptidyl aminopeptidases/acylaminoacyl-peptidases
MNGQGDIFSEVAHRAGDAARNGMEFVAHAAKAAKEKVGVATRKARTYVAKKIHPQPAGAAIEPCPKNKKAERVAERKARLAASVERLKNMPAGRQRDALAHAIDRFARNNVAVERARLAEDAYNVGKGDPPEGWERVTGEALKKLGGTSELFPQLRKAFKAAEYRDGYYPDLYKSQSAVFGEERYVLSFRGTQGKLDGSADVVQAFGGDTEQYSKAVKCAQKLKQVLGDKMDITGHSMGGGMAAAAGIVTGSPVWAIDPAGVHAATLERAGKHYSRVQAENYVQNFVAEGEILDTVQSPAVQRTIWGGLTLALPAGGIALAATGRRAVMENGTVVYGAAGPIHHLPILANAKEISSGTNDRGVSPGIAGRVNNDLNPVQKVRLHGVAYVIAGMEQQKADDLLVMRKS